MKKLLMASVVALVASSVSAATLRVDVTVTDPGDAGFSAPVFRFDNLSDPGFAISSVALGTPFPIDYVLNVAAPYDIINPVGGTRGITLGEEASFDQNSGCTGGVAYDLTSFDAGDFFRFSVDPEAAGCGSAVIDIRSFLSGDQVSATVAFANGITLSGSDWTFELIDPDGGNGNTNQLYRLSLERTIDAPEPAALGLLGLGMLGIVSLHRRRV